MLWPVNKTQDVSLIAPTETEIKRDSYLSLRCPFLGCRRLRLRALRAFRRLLEPRPKLLDLIREFRDFELVRGCPHERGGFFGPRPANLFALRYVPPGSKRLGGGRVAHQVYHPRDHLGL